MSFRDAELATHDPGHFSQLLQAAHQGTHSVLALLESLCVGYAIIYSRHALHCAPHVYPCALRVHACVLRISLYSCALQIFYHYTFAHYDHDL